MYNFFAYMSRMRLIERWSLMRNNNKENILEHSADVAIIANALANIAKTVYNKDIDVNYVTTLSLFHDCSEVITGDLPTPIKYYNPEIKSAYSAIEKTAKNKLLSMLPTALAPIYDNYFNPTVDDYIHMLIKSADKLSALAKCIEEIKTGNTEFRKAKKAIEQELAKNTLEEVQYFIKNFVDGYKLALDDLD